jgi:GDP-4-dehydro-6-deoxy-D-mannose reductase
MHVLVTGANGFVGHHVIQELTSAGHAVTAMVEKPAHKLDGVPSYPVDISDAEKVDATLAKIKPDACIHLAGMAFVPMAWERPQLVLDVNVRGTINLLEAFRAHAKHSRVLVITSSEVYGRDHTSDEQIDEACALTPSNLYGVTKVAADLAALSYAQHYGMNICTARPQNHIGPGQSDQFVVSSFARQLVEYAHGKTQGSMAVGNLESERDFTDVRDVARAYRLLIESNLQGEAFNISSGKNIRIQTILETLCKIAGVSPSISIDPAYHRPTDRPAVLSSDKIRAATGWKPEYSLRTSLEDIYRDIETRTQSPSS